MHARSRLLICTKQLSEVARRLDRDDLAEHAQVAKSVFNAEAVAIKLEAELWKKRQAISSLV